MKLRDLVDLCDPEMEIKIVTQGGSVPCMTVRKLVYGGEWAYLLDREVIQIDYIGILKKWLWPWSERTMAVWVEGLLFRSADREKD